MKLRIAFWASIGAEVVALWSLYFGTMHPSMHTIAWMLDVTCPIALLRHRAMSVYLVLLVNACTYALVGALVESAWQQYKRPRLIPN